MVTPRQIASRRPGQLAAIAVAVVLMILHFNPANALGDDLVDGTYTSATSNIRFTPPRKDWRISTSTPYPGVLLWIRHVPSTALMLFTGQTITEAQACQFPKECQQGTLAQGAACALAHALKQRGLETATLNVADVAWFDFNTKRRFMRQAFVAFDDKVYTLVLSAESVEQRLMLSRAFERAIKTVRPNDDVAHADRILDPLRCSGLDAPSTPGEAAPNQPTLAQPEKPMPAPPPAGDEAPPGTSSQPQKSPAPPAAPPAKTP